MKKKKTPISSPKLFELQTGKEIPNKKGREGEVSKKIFSLLRKMKPGMSFLIKKNQESTVRVVLKNNNKTFKDYKLTIRSAEEGKDYKRVFRL